MSFPERVRRGEGGGGGGGGAYLSDPAHLFGVGLQALACVCLYYIIKGSRRPAVRHDELITARHHNTFIALTHSLTTPLSVAALRELAIRNKS